MNDINDRRQSSRVVEVLIVFTCLGLFASVTIPIFIKSTLDRSHIAARDPKQATHEAKIAESKPSVYSGQGYQQKSIVIAPRTQKTSDDVIDFWTKGGEDVQ